jgi:5-methyltetrahydrofolate--homocysteine methyltransferase
MMNLSKRINKLKELLEQRILIVDGAMGTAIQALELSAKDFGGEESEGCNEILNLTKPELISGIHKTYLQELPDIVETNSFGSTPLVLNEFGLGSQSYDISRAASLIAREAISKFETAEKFIFVAGSMGPTTRAISVTGGITWDELVEHYHIQAKGLIDGGADFLLLETAQDTLNVKAGLSAIDQLGREMDMVVPVAVQSTIEVMGTMLGGQDIEGFYNSLAHRDLLWIGINCSTGPSFMRDHVRTLSQLSRFPIAVIPNAGLPDEYGNYNEKPESLASTLESFIDEGWVNVLGGCCGTTPEHIKHIIRMSHNRPPRIPVLRNETFVSGLDPFVIDDGTRPVLVGERTNVLGSRKFKRLVSEGNWEAGVEIGRSQVRDGSQVLDICLQDPDRDETIDIITFLELLNGRVKVPLMLDSTDPIVLREALKRTPGKSIINSINLEDGEERLRIIVPLIKEFGAAVVVGCIDDNRTQGQAITKERKLSIAKRAFNLLTEKYDILPYDIIFDPLVFPIGTGDSNYVGSGIETIEGVSMIKKAFPEAKTILGISNVSFGLPTAGREVLNSVFFYHCVMAGLDMAIVNSQQLRRYASISQDEKKLAEDLIWSRGENPIAAFADHFRDIRPTKTHETRKTLPLNERISSCVVDGSKEGLFSDLDEALNASTALEIVNGPLMDGMDEVGRLFGKNELIVAEVLSSAEAMKAAVSHLEPHMDKDDIGNRGKILLATVKGDVHDIGKNLVDIIFTNNGYKVINLGIKIPPRELIDAFHRHKPDVIGLSGLLVKSAQMMVETAHEFKEAKIEAPILVGGAALTNRFTRLRIAPEYSGIVVYAGDAMNGLASMNALRDPGKLETLKSKLDQETDQIVAADQSKRSQTMTTGRDHRPRTVIETLKEVPQPPDLISHTIDDYDLSEIFKYINPVMLYVRHLGYRGKFENALKNGERKALELRSKVREIEDVMLTKSDIRARAVYKFFRAASVENDLLILSSNGDDILARFQFGRPEDGEKLCISDYIRPLSLGKDDYIGLFVTTIGPGVRDLANDWMTKGEYLNSHVLQAIALESAEAFAELLHKRMRSMCGFGDPANMTIQDVFKAKYRGSRYSFGYPACPRLEDQAQIWQLLNPEERLGVSLTEEFMMDPEGSVSALVFHHPMAKYFSLSSSDVESLERRLGAASEENPASF